MAIERLKAVCLTEVRHPEPVVALRRRPTRATPCDTRWATLTANRMHRPEQASTRPHIKRPLTDVSPMLSGGGASLPPRVASNRSTESFSPTLHVSERGGGATAHQRSARRPRRRRQANHRTQRSATSLFTRASAQKETIPSSSFLEVLPQTTGSSEASHFWSNRPQLSQVPHLTPAYRVEAGELLH